MPRISMSRRIGEPDYQSFSDLHSVREIQFAGNWIKEAPSLSNRLSLSLPGNTKTVIFFCLVVWLWGLMHGGDWGTAHTAGAFFVALAGYASKSLHEAH